MRVAVLGAGSWGTTVASLAAVKNDTTLWARASEVADEIRDQHTNAKYLPEFELPKQLHATADMEEAVRDADLIIAGVPSHGFRQVLEQAAPHSRPWIPIVSLTKGFEAETLLRMTEVIRELFPGHPAAALTGPNLAREIMSGQAAASVIATRDLSVASALQSVLRRGVFRIYMNHDVIGCEVAGALKNVVAIAAGIAQGISVGDNTRAAVITRGVAELSRLGVAMGGEAPTFAGLAGMGDLIATCISPHSRNRYVGEQLGLGRPLAEILDEMHMVAEGVKTAVTVMQLAERYGVEMPICQVINRVITGEISALDAYRGLRPAGHELEPG
jgi:glycerol-3-phosphate dehydrogenase (NAD(P)+)